MCIVYARGIIVVNNTRLIAVIYNFIYIHEVVGNEYFRGYNNIVVRVVVVVVDDVVRLFKSRGKVYSRGSAIFC